MDPSTCREDISSLRRKSQRAPPSPAAKRWHFVLDVTVQDSVGLRRARTHPPHSRACGHTEFVRGKRNFAALACQATYRIGNICPSGSDQGIPPRRGEARKTLDASGLGVPNTACTTVPQTRACEGMRLRPPMLLRRDALPTAPSGVAEHRETPHASAQDTARREVPRAGTAGVGRAARSEADVDARRSASTSKRRKREPCGMLAPARPRARAFRWFVRAGLVSWLRVRPPIGGLRRRPRPHPSPARTRARKGRGTCCAARSATERR